MQRWCDAALLPTLVPPCDGTVQTPDVNNAGHRAPDRLRIATWVVNKPNEDRIGLYGFGSMTRASNDTEGLQALKLTAHRQTERRTLARNNDAVGLADIETDDWFERAGVSGRRVGPAHDGRGDELVGAAALPLDGDLALPPRQRRLPRLQFPRLARREQRPVAHATSPWGRSRGLTMASLATGVVVLVVVAIMRPVTPAPEPTARVEHMTAPLAAIGQAAENWREQIDRADRRADARARAAARHARQRRAAHRRAIARRRAVARWRAVRAADARRAARVPPAPARVAPPTPEFTPRPAPRRIAAEFDF
jgi:hypothetical protein